MRHNDKRKNNPVHSILDILSLGQIVWSPKSISGGLLHRMWKVSTEKGDYAIKILNPEIMSRSEAYGNFILSEKVARQAELSGIDAICALMHDDSPLIRVGWQYAMIFEWMEWCTLPELPVSEDISEMMGAVLARIHDANIGTALGMLPDLPYTPVCVDSHVHEYLDPELSAVIKNSLERYSSYISFLNADLVMSHRDLDQKNVLWDANNTPYLIDWESAGWINPMVELVTMALNWGGIVSGEVKREAFVGIIRGYQSIHPIDSANFEAYLSAHLVWPIEWLAYNVKRLQNGEDVEIAKQEIEKTRRVIEYFAYNQAVFLGWLRDSRFS